MRFHLCKEIPCSVGDKRCAEILKNGLRVRYVETVRDTLFNLAMDAKQREIHPLFYAKQKESQET